MSSGRTETTAQPFSLHQGAVPICVNMEFHHDRRLRKCRTAGRQLLFLKFSLLHLLVVRFLKKLDTTFQTFPVLIRLVENRHHSL